MKTFMAVATAILLMVAGAFLYSLYQDKFGNKLLNTPTPTIIPTTTVETQTPTAIPPTQSQVSDLDLIKKAFAQKYNKTVDQVEVNISKKDETHAWGNVKFSGEMAGGWFLAFKKSTNEWIIVQDGNGTISCETIEPYNFPTDMASECVDKNGKLIQR